MQQSRGKLSSRSSTWQRKRKYDLRRDILDAIFYLAKTGCQWPMLPREFAPWTAVYYYFRRWKGR